MSVPYLAIDATGLPRDSADGMTYRSRMQPPPEATDWTIAREPDLTAADFIDLMHRSGLAPRRPVGDVPRVTAMIRHSDVLLTARLGRVLIGVSRAITDFAYCTYLSDLAVDTAHQHRGIGQRLVAATHEAAGLHTRLVLLAAPTAGGFYQHIGMTPHDSCWTVPPREA